MNISIKNCALAFIAAIGFFLGQVLPVFTQEAQGGSGSVVELQDNCGNRPLSMASMQWPSSKILAYIHAKILTLEFGCKVEVIQGEMSALISSMAAAGEPAIVPEIWITRIADVWNGAVETGRVRQEGRTFDVAVLEGWYLPPYLKERLPEVNSIADLKEFASQMRAGGQKIRFISCPADWACSIINRNLLRALDLENEFEIIVPKNRFEMDVLIGEAVSKNQAVIFYYWQPNAILAQFDFFALDMGEFNDENFQCLAQSNCFDPKLSSFADEKIFFVTADWVVQEAPTVTEYIRRANMPIGEMNLILSWQAEEGLSFEQLAQRFVDERNQVWGSWIEGLQ